MTHTFMPLELLEEFMKLLTEYAEEQLPGRHKPFHPDKEVADGLQDLARWVRDKMVNDHDKDGSAIKNRTRISEEVNSIISGESKETLGGYLDKKSKSYLEEYLKTHKPKNT